MRPLLGLALAAAGCAAGPAEVAILPSNADTTDDLTGVWRTDAEPHRARYEWARNGEIVPDLRGPDVPANRTAKGQTWTVTVTDLQRGGTVAQAELVIRNAAPQVTPTLSPSLPDRVSGIQVDPGSVDPDGDAVTVSTTWTVEGVTVSEADSHLDGTFFQRGDHIQATVVARDSELETVGTVTVVVWNAPATIDVVVVTPPDPTRGDILRCETGGWSDADGDLPAYHYGWHVNGADLDVNAFELDAAALLQGDEVVCVATPWDGIHAGEMYFSAPILIFNRPPTLAGAHIDPTDAYQETALTCTGTGYADADGDPWVDSHYEWLINGLQLPVTEVTLDRYFSRGDLISCRIAADDGIDLGDWVESAATEVLNTAPVLTDAWIDPPGDAREATVLSCLGGGFSDVDGDSWVDSRYEWYVNGALVHADGPTLDGNDFDKGDFVSCRVAADDSFELGNWVESLPTDVVNTGPSNVVVTTDPDPVYAHDRVRCSVSADDPDGDALSWTVSWERDGQPFEDTETTEFPGDTIGAYRVGFDELWRCVATPDDGLEVGETGEATFATDPPIGGNILVIVADDLGIDHLLSYGVAPEAPPTPTLDALAAEGVQFENAYAYEVCSPTRAAIMTGRYGRRTGSGDALRPESDFELPLEEVILPEMLRESSWFVYANSAIGKWHLGSAAAPSTVMHPNLSGFDDFRGSGGNLIHSLHEQTTGFYLWEKITNGTIVLTKAYATTITTDDAIDRIDVMPEPWFAYVAYNAPHAPWHVPPFDLHSYPDLDTDSSPALRYDAMVEALDTEIGRLLDTLSPEVRARTTVIFIGDNGTPVEVITEPFDDKRGKDTPYEGGIHVPMIVTGPLVTQPGTTSDALVHVLDIYPTMAHLAGVRMGDMTKLNPEGEVVPINFDGQSLARWLVDPDEPSIRESMYMEKFSPNFGGGNYHEDITIGRNDRWKLIRTPSANEFFDLTSSPYDEGEDLLRGEEELSPEQQEGFDLLTDFVRTKKATLAYEGPPKP